MLWQAATWVGPWIRQSWSWWTAPALSGPSWGQWSRRNRAANRSIKVGQERASRGRQEEEQLWWIFLRGLVRDWCPKPNMDAGRGVKQLALKTTQQKICIGYHFFYILGTGLNEWMTDCLYVHVHIILKLVIIICQKKQTHSNTELPIPNIVGWIYIFLCFHVHIRDLFY